MSLFDVFYRKNGPEGESSMVGKERGMDPSLFDETPRGTEESLRGDVDAANNELSSNWHEEQERTLQNELRNVSDNDMRRARRMRNAALMSDLAKVFMQSRAKDNGVWEIDKMNLNSARANDEINNLYKDRSLQAKKFAERMISAKGLDRQEILNRNAAAAEAKRKADEAEAARKQKEKELEFQQDKLNLEKEKVQNEKAYQQGVLNIRAQNANNTRNGAGKDKDSIYATYVSIISENPEYEVTERVQKLENEIPVGYEFLPVKYPSYEQMQHQIARYNYDKEHGKLKQREPEPGYQSAPYFSVVPNSVRVSKGKKLY